jgi:hypothetical protein
MVKLLGIFISSGIQRLPTAGGNNRRALRGCQRLAVGTGPPYNRGPEPFHLSVEYHGGRDEFAPAALQKRRPD